jgi:hypothetical protein
MLLKSFLFGNAFQLPISRCPFILPTRRSSNEIYGIALGVSTICVFFGCFMLLKNGMASEMFFFASSSRHTLWIDFVRKLCRRKARLRYVELIGEQHECFRLDHEIRKL